MRIIAVICAVLALAACATPVDKVSTIAGRTVVEHIDYTDNPCQTRGPTGGCSTMIGGVQHIWYSGAEPGYVRRHELAHAEMAHTDWAFDERYGETCATVTRAGKGYPLGATICTNGRRERVFMGPA